MGVREQLAHEIGLLKIELKAKRYALHLLTEASATRGDNSSLRFYGVSALEAMRTAIKEAGRPMSRKELHNLLVAGGNINGKERGESTISVSIKVNLKNGNLVAKGDLIDLPNGGSVE
jgi:hypothetical protein